MKVSRREAREILKNAFDYIADKLENDSASLELFNLGAVIAESLLTVSGSHDHSGGTTREIADIESEIADGLTAGVAEYTKVYGIDNTVRRFNYKGYLLH
jgi:hypothetical protein